MNREDILSICKYIDTIDRNSDIMDFFNEYERKEVPLDSMIECFKITMFEWMEDIIFNGITEREKKIYELLGISIANASYRTFHVYYQKENDFTIFRSDIKAMTEEQAIFKLGYNIFNPKIKSVIEGKNL